MVVKVVFPACAGMPDASTDATASVAVLLKAICTQSHGCVRVSSSRLTGSSQKNETETTPRACARGDLQGGGGVNNGGVSGDGY